MDQAGRETEGSKSGPRGTLSDARNVSESRAAKGWRFLTVSALMFLLWIVLSGRFDAFHLTLGLLSSGLVAHFSGDLLFPASGARVTPRTILRYLAYLPWLLYQIFLASVHLLRLAFHPRMMSLIEPHVLRFSSKLKSEGALITFANSITLTPGTITVFVSMDGEFRVHAIDTHSGDSLPGEMERRIAKVFGES